MSESETTQEIGPRFTKATIIRISAVAFFVTLGSVAVIQSMKYVSSGSNEAPSQLASDVENTALDDGTLKGATTSPVQPPSAFNKPLDSAASRSTFIAPTLKTTGSSDPAKSTPPPTQSFKPVSPSSSALNGVPIVKATPTAIRPDRFAFKGPAFALSNPGSTSGLPDDLTKNQGNKNSNSKKPDPFRIKTPSKETSDFQGIKTTQEVPANNSATRLLDQVNEVEASNQSTPKPQPNAFAKPFAKPFQPNLTNSQPPQTTTSDPTKANIDSFNNRTPTPNNLVAIPTNRPDGITSTQLSPGLSSNNPNSLQTSRPSAFASKPPLTATPAPTNIKSPLLSRQPETPRALTPPTNSINSQTPRSFESNRALSNAESTSSRSSFTNLPSPPNAIAAPPVSRLTRDTPGDRQLDGIQAPSLTVEKLSPVEIQLNQQASFEIIVRNIGRVTAEEVQVIDQVPAGCEFIGATPQTKPQGKMQSLNWNLGALRPGQEKKITFQLKPIQPGEMGSVAQVTFATQASMRTLVTKPVLEIVHQTEATHLIGDSVVLDVIVINKGDGPAKNVMIQQKVPEQLEFPDGLPNASRRIEYEVGTLMPGKSQRVKLALKAANIGKIQSIMYASAEGGLRAKHELPIEVIAPKLVTQSSGPKKRFLKRSATHEFRVANQGTAKATNVQLIAKLPNGLRFVQANNQGRYDSESHAVYWSLAELAQNIEAQVELKTMPVDVGNQPIKFESSADLNIKSALEHDLSVEHLVDVFFEIDDVIDPIEIGGDTNYRVRVVNQGTKAATNIRLQIDFPTGLAPTSVNGSVRHAIRGQQVLFEPINSMNPGDELNFMVSGRGQSVGDHRVVVSMQTDGRTSPVSKQESTRVYSDQ